MAYSTSLLFMIISSVVAFVVGFRNRNKIASLRLIYCYPLASFIQSVIFSIDYSYWDFSDEMWYFTRTSSTQVFLLAELCIVYHFYSYTLKSHLIKNLLRIIGVIYIISAIIFWVIFSGLTVAPNNFYLMQAILLLIPTITYFIELVLSPSMVKLSKHPEFYVSIGILFYTTITLPLIVMKDYVYSFDIATTKNIYVINNAAYGIEFILFAIAYKRK